MQAMQEIAKKVLVHYRGRCSSFGDTWETMTLWEDTLSTIQDLDSICTIVHDEAHTLLEDCLYAFLVIQAHAISFGDPMLLLTPELLELLKPLQPVLAKCQLLETARTVIRLYWMAVKHAGYGADEEAFMKVWENLPWFGVRPALSGTQSPRSSLRIHTFLSMCSNTMKEQLCTNASETPGWKRRPPPYVDHVDITIPYCNHYVSPPCLFPPLSLLLPDATLEYNSLDPHVQEDRQLLLLADFPENPNVLEHLQLDDWKKAFRKKEEFLGSGEKSASSWRPGYATYGN